MPWRVGMATCTHEVAWSGVDVLPPDVLEARAPEELSPSRARQYTFPLDEFQRIATACVERGESVLVCAHTSAGKTVCAEHAVAVGLRDRQRVVYTSPIKALSNQKYQELKEQFGDVGLLTGDTTLNEEASCLVMTTEILRAMLYKGSTVMHEVKWVVFDEAHLLGSERGWVIEECLILAPQWPSRRSNSGAAALLAVRRARWAGLTAAPRHTSPQLGALRPALRDAAQRA